MKVNGIFIQRIIDNSLNDGQLKDVLIFIKNHSSETFDN